MRPLLLALLFLLVAAPARAGTYDVVGWDGWSPVVRAPRGYVSAGSGAGQVTVEFHTRGVFDQGDLGEWVASAPADATIVAWDVEAAVSGIGAGGWNTLFAVTGEGRTHFVATEVPARNRPFALMRAGGLSASRVAAILDCAGPGSCRAAGTAILRLRNPRLTLADAFAPAPSAPHGDLAGTGVLRGRAALSFTATDRGGGLYRAYAIVDGRRLAPVPIGDERCHPLGADHAFAFRRPCPLSGGAVVALDTTALSEGAHTVAVAVEDAAGNAVTVYGPTTRVVDNVPPPRVAPPAVRRPPVLTPRYALMASFAGHARAVTVPYGARARIRGRLTLAPGARRAYETATAPVAAVPLAVASRTALPDAPWRALTGVTTRADGRFTLFAPAGPSRRLRIVAPGGAAAELVLRVRARVTARAGDGTVRGRVRGARRGVLVEIQSRVGRRWVTRRVVRTFSTGHYTCALRARGSVRARVPRQPGLPYAAGVSPPRRAGRTAPRTSR